jgi:hypothetical protein
MPCLWFRSSWIMTTRLLLMRFIPSGCVQNFKYLVELTWCWRYYQLQISHFMGVPEIGSTICWVKATSFICCFSWCFTIQAACDWDRRGKEKCTNGFLWISVKFIQPGTGSSKSWEGLDRHVCTDGTIVAAYHWSMDDGQTTVPMKDKARSRKPLCKQGWLIWHSECFHKNRPSPIP